MRATIPQQRSMARRAKRSKYGVVWSDPPPRTTTFEVAPGGTAILARHPIAISKVTVAHTERWESLGRVCAAKIVLGNFVALVVSVYGFAVSHPMHRQNDVMLKQVFAWIAGQTLPVLLGGDLNTTVGTSDALALAPRLGLWRLTKDEPTTKSKVTGTPVGPPLDHVYCNNRMIDLQPRAVVAYSIPLSDHFPIVGGWSVHEDMGILTWQWPREMDVEKEPVRVIEWGANVASYTEWAEKAVSWLADTFACDKHSKITVTSQPMKEPHVHQDPRYKVLKKVQGCISRYAREGHDMAWKRVERAMEKAGLKKPLDSMQAEQIVSKAATSLFDMLEKESLANWKSRVKEWHSSSATLFAYLKNHDPAKLTAVRMDSEKCSILPRVVHWVLEAYWEDVESWPSPASKDHAIESIEDVYAAFLPNCMFHFVLIPVDLFMQARVVKKSAQGPDGWTQKELQKLPLSAWDNVLQVIKTPGDALASSTLGLCKRVPIAKTDHDIPSPDQIRPIDVYSMLL